MSERMFKKFPPQAELSSDDLRFLNSHTMIQKDFVEEMDPEGGRRDIPRDKFKLRTLPPGEPVC